MHQGHASTRGAPWRRTGVTAAVAGVALALALGLPGTVQTADAQTADGESTAAQTGAVRNGTAKATATVGRYIPGVGELAFGITNGVAVTQLTNELAQATSQVADLGLIGSSLTAEGCDGGAATLTADDLPQPTSVDNRSGDASARRDESGTQDAPLGTGRMDVAATGGTPSSTAVVTAAALDLAGGLRIGAGQATATTRVLPGVGREALSTVTSSLELADVVELSGLRWSATHRTGTDELIEGSFEIGRAALAGIPLPTDDLQAVGDALNALLAPSGITISLPVVERITDPLDLIKVTPLQVEIRDTPVGKAVLGPGLEATRQERIELFDSLVESFCDAAGALFIGDIGISVVSGTGFLTIALGGVEATSADFVVRDPFGAIPPAPAGEPVAAPSPAPGAGVTPRVPTGGGSPPAPGAAPATPGAGVEVAAPVAVAERGPVEELCRSIHPNADSCSQGSAAAVGIVGLLATAAVAGADLRRQRREPGVPR